MKNAAILVLLALLPLVAALGYVIGQPAAPAHKAAVNWIYGPRMGPIPTNEKGVVVLCQEKTNSPDFRDHKRAAAGDVDTMTCRAVKAKKLKKFPPEPKS